MRWPGVQAERAVKTWSALVANDPSRDFVRHYGLFMHDSAPVHAISVDSSLEGCSGALEALQREAMPFQPSS